MSEEATKTPLVFDALQEPLLQVLAQSASCDPEAKVDPKESLSWPAFVRIVVYYFLAGLSSGRLLLTHLASADPKLNLPSDLKKSTFFEAFRRFPAALARELFHALLSHLKFFPVAEMASLGLLCAVDGSHWPAMRDMTWALVGSNKPTFLLHLAFSLNHMVSVAMLVGESNSSERLALRKMLQAGVTYVADRGYFAYYLLNDIANANAFFVIRATCNVSY
jgi:hypothetical protein